MFLCFPQITFFVISQGNTHNQYNIGDILIQNCRIEKFKSAHLILHGKHSTGNKNKIAVEYSLIACLCWFKRQSYTYKIV